MLSAFTARPIIELKQRDKSKIESILAYGDRVLVGLNTGSLRIYRVNDIPPPSDPPNHPPSQASTSQPSHDEPPPPPPPPPQKPTDLLREVEKFSPRAIEQLAIIKGANTLVSLSNYTVSLHDLQTFSPIEAPLSKTKNASTFAVTSNVVQDPSTGVPEIISRLAVAVKRRLLLWSWQESELSPDVTEILLSESIRSLTWANATKIVCGMNGGFVIVDVETGSIEDIVGPGAIGTTGGGGGTGRFGSVSATGMSYMGLGSYIPKPLSTKLAEGGLLLAKDINTLFIDDSGRALEKHQIPWQSAPESIGYSYPYILALQPPVKGTLEVRNPDTLSLLQTISLPGAAALHFPPPTVSVQHTGKGFHVLSDRAVWKMEATDYDSQIDELVKNGRLDEAISVLGMLEDALLKNKTETMREVKMLKAEVLFKQKKYRESMDLFSEDEVDAPPERVLKLFPRIIAGDLSGVEEQEEQEEQEEAEEEEEEEEKKKKKKDDSDHEGSTVGKHSEPEVVASPPKAGGGGGGGFAKYLMGHRKQQLNPETASVASSRRTTQDDDAASVRGRSSEDHHAQEEKEKDLKNAVLELNSYLAGARARLQRVIDPATGKLKPGRARSEMLSASQTAAQEDLTLSSRQVDESELQLAAELQHTFKIVDTTLFRAFMYSRPQLASSLFRIPNFCDPDVVNERLVEHNRFNELVDFFYGKKLHREALNLLRKFGSCPEPDEAAPGLHGPQRTVGYLQGLPPEMIDVILEFSEWTLRKDPGLGMEVFLADTENAETLPRERVVEFLRGVDVALETRYLEHVVGELGDGTPEFHNRLVELFVVQLKEGKKKDGEWEGLMGRLVRFLRESRQYSLGRALSWIPKEDPSFYEAHAVVLSNMGQHRQALVIYVFKMKDYAKAEEYCNHIHKTQDLPPSSSPDQNDTDNTDQPSIYHTLLSLYLRPPRPHEPNLGPALDLLSKHGSRLPATSTLSLVPDDLPVAQLESYFRGRMRSANSMVNETRVVAGLRRTSHLAAQALLYLGDGIPGGQAGRNRRVVVGEERMCGGCHKRLGRSVVAVLPDNRVANESGKCQVGGWGGVEELGEGLNCIFIREGSCRKWSGEGRGGHTIIQPSVRSKTCDYNSVDMCGCLFLFMLNPPRRPPLRSSPPLSCPPQLFQRGRCLLPFFG
ncbi:Vacuolar morphogenesis protein 6 [Podospora pseudopauciseta]|uniref:Vacuolar morphogenesis protein 6 n=1 Tax=Podospora pseudopauciseta TaxID=2093780 RepID=A0ABR0HG99_9PEZI|nr:Vacuolar morphogenesis protein 6 [Podospora pseudopauciseta]